MAYQSRKKVAIDTIKNTIENETVISEPEDAEKIIDLVTPLIKNETDQPPADDMDKEDFEEEQNLVASLVHTFDSEDPGKLYKVSFFDVLIWQMLTRKDLSHYQKSFCSRWISPHTSHFHSPCFPRLATC